MLLAFLMLDMQARSRGEAASEIISDRNAAAAFTRCFMNVAKYLHYLAAGHVNFFPSGVEHTWADFLKPLFLISRKGL